MAIEPGLNLEFIRRSEKPFALGVELAAKWVTNTSSRSCTTGAS